MPQAAREARKNGNPAHVEQANTGPLCESLWSLVFEHMDAGTLFTMTKVRLLRVLSWVCAYSNKGGSCAVL